MSSLHVSYFMINLSSGEFEIKQMEDVIEDMCADRRYMYVTVRLAKFGNLSIQS